MMDGKDLHSRLQSVNKAGKRVLGWYGRGKTVALDVCRGLHYLHRRAGDGGAWAAGQRLEGRQKGAVGCWEAPGVRQWWL